MASVRNIYYSGKNEATMDVKAEETAALVGGREADHLCWFAIKQYYIGKRFPNQDLHQAPGANRRGQIADPCC